MHLASLALLPLISGGLMVASPVSAEEDPLAARRAINLARGSAVEANGGLRQYHPASCMFKDPTNNPCLVKRDANGFKFQFKGGPAGWEVLGLPATVESTVLVAPNGEAAIKERHQVLCNPSFPVTPNSIPPSGASPSM